MRTICTTDPNDPFKHLDPQEDATAMQRLIRDYGENYKSAFKPLKAKLPMCLEFDGSGPEEMKSAVCNPNGTCFGLQTYQKSDFVKDMNIAQKAWNRICGTQNQPCQCKVKIYFSDDETIFPSWSVVGRSNVSETKSYSLSEQPNRLDFVNNNCEVDCSKLFIVLNSGLRADKFVSSSYSNSESNSNWSNRDEDISPNVDTHRDDQKTMSKNLVRTLEIFMGELLNADINKSSAYPYDYDSEDPCDCTPKLQSYTNGIKYTEVIPDCQRCMFKKLYCPDYSGDFKQSGGDKPKKTSVVKPEKTQTENLGVSTTSRIKIRTKLTNKTN